jgi:hypothetical protein
MHINFEPKYSDNLYPVVLSLSSNIYHTLIKNKLEDAKYLG